MAAVAVLGGGLSAPAGAATYYLAPGGADGHAGTASAPWKTFAFAVPKLKPGDTLVLRAGTYTRATTGYPKVLCGKNASSGTSSQRITLKAEHERQAFLKGDGSAYPLYLDGCAYWTVDGLRAEQGDFKSSTLSNGHVFQLVNSKHLVVRRNLVRFNNRYKNGTILSLAGTTHSLVEENEVYSFHRNGIGGGASNTWRRNYVNSRGHADLSGGYASIASDRGDSGFIFYPSSNNIVENNISEGNDRGYDVQASKPTDNNRFYGSISLKDRYGALVTARGSGPDQMPHDNHFINFVAVNYSQVGLFSRSAEGTTCTHCTLLGQSSGANGVVADYIGSYPGDGRFSFFGTNVLAAGHSDTGILITQDIDTWDLTAVNSHAASPSYNPASSGNYDGKMAVDPKLGACRVFIPAGSPMKKAGQNGADIGATVLYRYQNGSLTGQPLWEPGSGKFPCGAVVAGVNDVAGKSCRDVHTRLNVQANGCALPSNYSAKAVASAVPQNLRVIMSD